MSISVSRHRPECRARLLRLESPEVQSLARSAQAGSRNEITDEDYSDYSRQKFAEDFKRITGVPVELRHELRAAYEKVLGQTVEEILEEEFHKMRYTSLPHGPHVRNKGETSD